MRSAVAAGKSGEVCPFGGWREYVPTKVILDTLAGMGTDCLTEVGIGATCDRG